MRDTSQLLLFLTPFAPKVCFAPREKKQPLSTLKPPPGAALVKKRFCANHFRARMSLSPRDENKQTRTLFSQRRYNSVSCRAPPPAHLYGGVPRSWSFLSHKVPHVKVLGTVSHGHHSFKRHPRKRGAVGAAVAAGRGDDPPVDPAPERERENRQHEGNTGQGFQHRFIYA